MRPFTSRRTRHTDLHITICLSIAKRLFMWFLVFRGVKGVGRRTEEPHHPAPCLAGGRGKKKQPAHDSTVARITD